MVSYYLITTCGLAKILAYNPPTPNAVPRALSNGFTASVGNCGACAPKPATCPKPAPYCCNLCWGSKAAGCAAC